MWTHMVLILELEQNRTRDTWVPKKSKKYSQTISGSNMNTIEISNQSCPAKVCSSNSTVDQPSCWTINWTYEEENPKNIHLTLVLKEHSGLNSSWEKFNPNIQKCIPSKPCLKADLVISPRERGEYFANRSKVLPTKLLSRLVLQSQDLKKKKVVHRWDYG